MFYIQNLNQLLDDVVADLLKILISVYVDELIFKLNIFACVFEFHHLWITLHITTFFSAKIQCFYHNTENVEINFKFVLLCTLKFPTLEGVCL